VLRGPCRGTGAPSSRTRNRPHTNEVRPGTSGQDQAGRAAGWPNRSRPRPGARRGHDRRGHRAAVRGHVRGRPGKTEVYPRWYRPGRVPGGPPPAVPGPARPVRRGGRGVGPGRARPGRRGGGVRLIYDRTWTRFFRFIYFRVGNRKLAEDLTRTPSCAPSSASAASTWQGRDLGAWLVTIARNLVADHFKSGRYRLEVTTGDVLDADREDRGPEGSPSPQWWTTSQRRPAHRGQAAQPGAAGMHRAAVPPGLLGRRDRTDMARTKERSRHCSTASALAATPPGGTAARCIPAAPG